MAAKEDEATRIQLYPTDNKLVPKFWADKYEKEAQKYWDVFYKQNQANFFKDRHYLFREFPELTPPDGASCHQVLEVGCGVGNAVYPVLQGDERIKVHCCDFSRNAVELVKKHALYDPARVNAFHCDITQTPLTNDVPEGTVDIVLLIFVISAISPEMMPQAIKHVKATLRRSPQSRVFLRDYACGDLAAQRFDKKYRQKIDDNFYVRGDGTRAFFFSREKLVQLFEEAGFETLQIKDHNVEVMNRGKDIKMDRQWIQGHFRLRETEW